MAQWLPGMGPQRYIEGWDCAGVWGAGGGGEGGNTIRMRFWLLQYMYPSTTTAMQESASARKPLMLCHDASGEVGSMTCFTTTGSHSSSRSAPAPATTHPPRSPGASAMLQRCAEAENCHDESSIKCSEHPEGSSR